MHIFISNVSEQVITVKARRQISAEIYPCPYTEPEFVNI
jgi:hypothetical protein